MKLLRLSVQVCALMAVLVGTRPACAISLGEVDHFSADLEGWKTGVQAGPGAVVRVAGGGPAGAGDAFLQVTVNPASTGILKMVVFNQAQWQGDFIAAGVTAVSMDVKFEGPDAMHLRLAFGTNDAPIGGGDWFVSNDAIIVPSGGGWTNIQFPISSMALGDYSGGEANYNDAMSNVATMRLLHVMSLSPFGDIVNTEAPTVVSVDNITALGGVAPIPGDLNGDGSVNAADLVQWRTDFATSAGSDADGDGDTDGNDFLIWQRNLGNVAGVAAIRSIPEPGAVALVLTAVAATVRSPWSVVRSNRKQLTTDY
jgi:hypothetical protein